MYDLNELQQENDSLRRENDDLRNRIKALEEHSPTDLGLIGEKFVEKVLSGERTASTKPYDIILKNGTRIEVKYASLSAPGRKSNTRRWVWRHVFGESGKKEYDFLILLGEPDARHKHSYKEQNESYVIFCIGFEIVKNFVSNAKDKTIFLTTNPLIKRKNLSNTMLLYTNHQFEAKNLCQELNAI